MTLSGHISAERILRLLPALLLLACDPVTNGPHTPPPGGGAPARRARLSAVDDFAYQLQADPILDLAPIAASAFDLVIIDPSADGSPEAAFSAAQIAALKASSDPPKIVLAYLSIGEAEIGRFYFDNAWITPDPDSDPDGPFTLTAAAPDFLVEPNPAFPDNFKVRYWLESWQQIIIHNPGAHPLIADQPAALDRILDAGFDGVYLDIIDAYEFFGPAELGGNAERPDAAANMIEFVLAIADHARRIRGQAGFLVFPQNGSGIIDESAFPADTIPGGQSRDAFIAACVDQYFAAIDGIGAEDTFYFGDDDEDNPLAPQDGTIALLDRFHDAGLSVLSTDYLTQPAAIDDFYARARARGWIPYATIRNLSTLTINPTQPPT